MPTPSGGPLKSGSSRSQSGSASFERADRRHEHEDAPEPVDDRRDGREQLGQEDERLPQPAGHSSEMKTAMPSATGVGDAASARIDE